MSGAHTPPTSLTHRYHWLLIGQMDKLLSLYWWSDNALNCFPVLQNNPIQSEMINVNYVYEILLKEIASTDNLVCIFLTMNYIDII